MTAATVVQQLRKSCRTCFKFYCMFYFTCDRSLTDRQKGIDKHLEAAYGSLAVGKIAINHRAMMTRRRMRCNADGSVTRYGHLSLCMHVVKQDSSWSDFSPETAYARSLDFSRGVNIICIVEDDKKWPIISAFYGETERCFDWIFSSISWCDWNVTRMNHTTDRTVAKGIYLFVISLYTLVMYSGSGSEGGHA